MKLIVMTGAVVLGVIFMFGYVPYKASQNMMLMHCYGCHVRDY